MTPPLELRWRPFRFALPQALVTAHGALRERAGWLLRLEAADGRLGWGEAAPLGCLPATAAPGCGHSGQAQQACRSAIKALGPSRSRQELEDLIPRLPAPLGFALGAALAELEGLVGEAAGGWAEAPPSAWLLPAGEALLPALEALPQAPGGQSSLPAPSGSEAAAAPSPRTPALPFTVKWKVAAAPDRLERELLERLLERLPAEARLRLDANGGWDRSMASAWASRLAGEPRLEWLEQPLAPDDREGLLALCRRLPVALDESLRHDPYLADHWPGWLVRRPALEGDPRPLLSALAAGRPRWMVSTAFETGIGRRWLQHLAALQALGPTPTAPGLAPSWCPVGPLFGHDPAGIWADLPELP